MCGVSTATAVISTVMMLTLLFEQIVVVSSESSSMAASNHCIWHQMGACTVLLTHMAISDTEQKHIALPLLQR